MSTQPVAPSNNYSWRVPEWFPTLSSETHDALKRYFEALIDINKNISIVSAKTIPYAETLHFADSIYASQLIHKENPQIKDIYDLGSGNGFPGLVFALLYPQTKVYLVETDARKVEGLKVLIQASAAKNVEVLHKTVESLPAESVNVAMCRDFMSISKTLLLMRKISSLQGKVYFLKGDEWSVEVAEMPTQLCAVWSPALVGNYKLPVAEVTMSVIRADRLVSR